MRMRMLDLGSLRAYFQVSEQGHPLGAVLLQKPRPDGRHEHFAVELQDLAAIVEAASGAPGTLTRIDGRGALELDVSQRFPDPVYFEESQLRSFDELAEKLGLGTEKLAVLWAGGYIMKALEHRDELVMVGMDPVPSEEALHAWLGPKEAAKALVRIAKIWMRGRNSPAG